MAASEEDWLKTKTFAMGKWGQRLAGVSARNCSQHFSVFKQSEKTNKNKNKKKQRGARDWHGNHWEGGL